MYAVIMAGGKGTRLWPVSRNDKPKQFQTFFGEKSLIRETYDRLLPRFKPEEIFVSTIPDFVPDVKKNIPEMADENIIAEPMLMGTAAACGLVSKILFERDNDSSVIFLPSDHVIENPEEFLKVVSFADQTLQKNPGHIIQIGIQPTKPDNGLGYIQTGEKIEDSNNLELFKVKRFVEKPDMATAEEYLKSGDYLWNAGIFIWKNSHILDLIKQNLPDTSTALDKIGQSIGKPDYTQVLKDEYAKVEKTTIDYGIIEKTSDLLVIPGDFGWSDVGNWGAFLEVLTKRNDTKVISDGNHIGVGDDNCMVLAGEKMIATVGLSDIVVIDTPDALLICNSNRSHEIKDLLDKMKENGKEIHL